MPGPSDAPLRQRAYFDSGATRPYAVRRDALRRLKAALRAHEEELLAALHADMRKPRAEAYMSDIAFVHAEIDGALRNLRSWMRPQRLPTPLAIQPAESLVCPEPLGVVLIIAPWNYPALLVLAPLVGAIAAGNCAVVKPSEDAPATAAVVERLIAAALPPEHACAVQGVGAEVVPALMQGFRFDHVFFSGSPRVGRAIMAMAAPQLVPVTLELGGKSPAIVDATASIGAAARRIAWSKYLNAGQTCMATDHALVHRSVMDQFLDRLARCVQEAYGKDPQQSPHYARMVNHRRFDAVSAYLGQGHCRVGGATDRDDRYIAPAVLTEVDLESPVMREEIFGPVLPVIPWSEPEEAIAIAGRNPFPLAAYIFSSSRKAQRLFQERIAFGGGCINHCLLQFGPGQLPFGGVGISGMGRYHGRSSFERFSNLKGMVRASTLIGHGLQYPPYSRFKERMMRLFLP